LLSLLPANRHVDAESTPISYQTPANLLNDQTKRRKWAPPAQKHGLRLRSGLKDVGVSGKQIST